MEPQTQQAPQAVVSAEEKPKTSKFLVFLVFILFLGVIGSGAVLGYYLLSEPPEPEPTPAPVVKEKEVDFSDYVQVVMAYYRAVEKNDKAEARRYLSEKADKDAFRSTLDDNYEGPSIFGTRPNYSITKTSVTNDGMTAYVILELEVEGEMVDGTITLEKEDSKWLMTNALFTIEAESLPESARDASKLASRLLIMVAGQADLYITTPDGMSTGYNPETKLVENEIEGVFYDSILEAVEIRTLAISTVYSSWELKVPCLGEGGYAVLVRTVETLAESTVEGECVSSEQVDKYILTYPEVEGGGMVIVSG